MPWALTGIFDIPAQLLHDQNKTEGESYREKLAQNKNRLVSNPKIPEQLPVGSCSGMQPGQDNSGEGKVGCLHVWPLQLWKWRNDWIKMKSNQISEHADHQQLLLSPPAGLDGFRMYWNTSKIPNLLVLCFKSCRVTRTQEGECWQKKNTTNTKFNYISKATTGLKIWISSNSDTEQDEIMLNYCIKKQIQPNKPSHNKPTYRLQLNPNCICHFKASASDFHIMQGDIFLC